MNNTQIEIRTLGGFSFVLLKDFTYRDVTVKKGFISNGANVPRFAWSIVPPNYMEIQGPIVIHDYLCKLEFYTKADDLLEVMLKERNITKFQRRFIMLGVRLYTKLGRPILKFFNMHTRD